MLFVEQLPEVRQPSACGHIQRLKFPAALSQYRGSGAADGLVSIGDILVAVDGMPVRGCSMNMIQHQIVGDVGTMVHLTFDSWRCVLPKPLSTTPLICLRCLTLMRTIIVAGVQFARVTRSRRCIPLACSVALRLCTSTANL